MGAAQAVTQPCSPPPQPPLGIPCLGGPMCGGGCSSQGMAMCLCAPCIIVCLPCCLMVSCVLGQKAAAELKQMNLEDMAPTELVDTVHDAQPQVAGIFPE